MRILLLILLLCPLAAGAETRVPQSEAQIHLSFAPVVARAAPAVVNIYATKVVAGGASPFDADPFFSQFFGDRPQVERALGSGVILRGDGIVVSNYHVVGEASEIRVVLADRREFPARVILADADADLAVIKLDGATDLPALQLTDSDAIQVGDLVLAIGNPFGVGQTVTSGIVSGLARSGGSQDGGGRDGGGQAGSGYFIQTDAAINPGNSGGALVDLDGRLVGVNTSILSRSGGSMGIGFAIPANLVAAYVAAAEAGRTAVDRPWSGIEVQPVDAAMAQAMSLPAPDGVAIVRMHPDSPFAAAGLAEGDVLLALDGQPVESAGELNFRLMELGTGTQAGVSYWHDGARHQGQVVLKPAPGGDAAPVTLATGNAFDGLVVADLTPALAERLHLGIDANGVVVVDATGDAQALGLEPGDLIRSVNDREVTGVQALVKLVAGGRRGWRIIFDRGPRQMILRFRG